jgi:hypothetical protein
MARHPAAQITAGPGATSVAFGVRPAQDHRCQRGFFPLRQTARRPLGSRPTIPGRHKAQNGFCTYIGNDRFAWFGTTRSKSRRNFLEILRPGHDDYVINTQALAYMRGARWPGR